MSAFNPPEIFNKNENPFTATGSLAEGAQTLHSQMENNKRHSAGMSAQLRQCKGKIDVVRASLII